MPAAAPAAHLLPTGNFAVVPETSTATFSVAHFRLQTVRGTLSDVRGEVALHDGRLTARGSIDAASIRTGTPPRDAHLRGFLLRAERHPRLELTVDAELPTGAAPTVAATLWVRGRPVTVPVVLEQAGNVEDEPRLRASIALDRRAAGLTWPAPVEAGGVAVGRTVTVVLDLALRRA